MDDVHEIGVGTGGAALLESLVRYAPPGLHLVFGTRHEPPFAVARLRGSGGLLEVHARDLAFSAADVETVVETRLGGESRDLAPGLLEATGGWPVAVYLATEALRSADGDARRRIVDSLVGHSDELFAFLAEEVIAREPPSVVALLGRLAELERAPAALVDALGEDGDALRLGALARRGLVAEGPGETREYTLHALVREFLVASVAETPERRQDVHRRAAVWYADHDRPADGLREAIAGGDPELTARLMKRFAQLANWDGSADLVIEAAATIPEPLRPVASPAAVSHSHIIRGDFAQARAWMSVWAAEPETLSPYLRDSLAVQSALLAIGEGSAVEALRALERYGEESSSFVASFTAYQLLDLGRVDEAQAMAARGMALGLAGPPDVDPHWDTDNDLAEAHQVAGEVELERERPALAAKHFDEALRYARRAGNLLAGCATISRQSDAALRLGDAEGALAHAVASLELADRIGFSQFQASARVHQGRALRALGRLDEARSAFTAAIAISERFGSHAIAIALVEIGEVQLEQGEAARARATLERALFEGRASEIVHVVATAGAALAMLLAAEDLDAAVDLLDATRPPDGPSRWRSVFRLAEGWVALRAGDRDRADALADAIVDEAAAGDALPALASGLELRCFASAEPARRAASLEEAARIWATLGHPLAEARAVLALQAIGCAVAESEVERARAILARQAVRIPGLGVGLGAMIGADRFPPLAIRTFGRFTVYHDGVEVPVDRLAVAKGPGPPQASRLPARRGDGERRAARGALAGGGPLEDAQPALGGAQRRAGSARSRRRSRDGLVRGRGPRRAPARPRARPGRRRALPRQRARRARGRPRGVARRPALLDAAEAAYGGEFLEEDAFADWAIPLRERVRSAYVDLLRALTRVEHESDRFHLRLLEIDPYDEDAHLDLVRMLASSGRHGEAQRAYRRYVTRMAEIGVEPEPLDLAGASGAAL